MDKKDNSLSREELENQSDEDLLLLAQDGEEEAFLVLYDRHQRRILSYAYTILGEHQGPWDVLQETFLYLFKKLPTYKPTAKFTTLLYKVVKNLSVNLAKKKRRVALIPDEMISEMPTYLSPESDLFNQDEAEQINQLIHSLPQIYREVLYLNLAEELEYKEISEILGCPLGTVKSRIHYGWKKIREAMKKKNISPF